MAKKLITQYVCTSCGRNEPKWMGKCPTCGQWNTYEEETITCDTKTVNNINNIQISSQVLNLSDVSVSKTIRIDTSLKELNRVLGGGLMSGSSVLLGGEPGIGKSTLVLQLACLGKLKNVLYISGEEGASQVKLRSNRLNLDTSKVKIYCGSQIESIMDLMHKEKPELVIIDSLQTLSSGDSVSLSGSVNQLKICATALTHTAKSLGCSIIFIGHVTKDGTIAGPKMVEHIVDTVLYFEASDQGVRIIRAAKNRYGSVDEIGLFIMGEKGLVEVEDPTRFFISHRAKGYLAPGISYTAIFEGTRTFLVEIQALVIESKSGYRHIYSDKIDTARVSRIAAVLEKHASVQLSYTDIYINVAGGVKLSEVSIDLALALAIYSAATGKALDPSIVFIGEVSLAGEVRNVGFLDKRLKASKALGFTKALVPCQRNIDYSEDVIGCLSVKKAITYLFN